MKPTRFYVAYGPCAVEVRVSQADIDAATNPAAMLGTKTALALETARRTIAEEREKGRRQAAEMANKGGL